MSFDKMYVRRKILELTGAGSSTEMDGPHDLIEHEAKSFGRARGIRLLLERVGGSVRVTRLADRQKGMHAYPEIAGLAPGQSVLLDVPPASHQRVRVTASQTSMKTGATYRCLREGDAIRVVRTDGADVSADLPVRATKYSLDRLSTGERLVFHVEPRERTRLRSACSTKGLQTGWTIRCRLQDDGSMLVYRTDVPAQQQAGDSAAE